MPNRILKESICFSDDINRMSAFEETVFYRLIVCVDDFGRIDGRIAFLKSRLFPLKEDMRSSQLEKAIETLSAIGTVKTYNVGKKPFLQLTGWDRHQTPRASKSKFPGPEDADADADILQASACNCTQMNADENNCKQMSPYSIFDIRDSKSDIRYSGIDARAKTRSKKQPKTQYADFVSLTEAEYGKLVAEIGEPATLKAIDILNSYKGSSGKKYASDYLAMRNWTLDRVRKDHPELFRAASKPQDPSENPFEDWGGFQ